MVEQNGAKILPPNLQAPPNVISQEQAIAILEQAIGPSMQLLLKGVQASMPAFPSPLIMMAASKVVGHLVGVTFAGTNAPLAPMMKARTDCKEMFEKAVRTIPINATNGGAAAPMMPIPPKPQG